MHFTLRGFIGQNVNVEKEEDKEIFLGKEVVQLKTNKIQKGLVALERVFDYHDKTKNKATPLNLGEVEKVNLRTKHGLF